MNLAALLLQPSMLPGQPASGNSLVEQSAPKLENVDFEKFMKGLQSKSRQEQPSHMTLLNQEIAGQLSDNAAFQHTPLSIDQALKILEQALQHVSANPNDTVLQISTQAASSSTDSSRNLDPEEILENLFGDLAHKITLSKSDPGTDNLQIPSSLKNLLGQLSESTVFIPAHLDSTDKTYRPENTINVFDLTEGAQNKEQLFEQILQNLQQSSRSNAPLASSLILLNTTPQQLNEMQQLASDQDRILFDSILIKPSHKTSSGSAEDLMALIGLTYTTQATSPANRTQKSADADLAPSLKRISTGNSAGPTGHSADPSIMHGNTLKGALAAGQTELPRPSAEPAGTPSLSTTPGTNQLLDPDDGGFRSQLAQESWLDIAQDRATSNTRDALTPQQNNAPSASSSSQSVRPDLPGQPGPVSPLSVSVESGGVMEWFDPASQEWTSAPTLPSAMSGTNASSVLTQAASATAAHPASQIISVHIQKQAQGGENRNWSLQLNPPDLGRVEIEMRFEKDTTLKAHIIAEKPETYMMLQRDSQLLEKALQQAGLDLDQNSLSFELDQNDDFGTRGEGQSPHGRQGDGANEHAEEENLNTTMDWYFDSDTGMQRYDLIA